MKIKKVQLDEFIGKGKRYLAAIRNGKGTESEFEIFKSMCRDLLDQADELFGFTHGCAMYDIVIGLCRVNPDIANEGIYKVLEVLGCEVTE